VAKQNRTYKLDDGLQEQLQASLKPVLEAHMKEWLEEVDNGEIGEECCAILTATRQIASKRDSRLTPIPAAEE
jgi:hypothetical protein